MWYDLSGDVCVRGHAGAKEKKNEAKLLKKKGRHGWSVRRIRVSQIQERRETQVVPLVALDTLQSLLDKRLYVIETCLLLLVLRLAL